MFNKALKEEFASMRVEILDLNVAAYFFIRKINRWAFLWKTTSREHILEELTALRYLENGLILHLTNLDDDRSNYSFRSAFKELNKTLKDDRIIAKTKSKLKGFRGNLNNLKIEHRNKRIAHLNYDEDLTFDEFLDFENALLPLILEANEIGNLLWGEPIKVTFGLGSLEGILDFHKDTENLKIDPYKEQGF